MANKKIPGDVIAAIAIAALLTLLGTLINDLTMAAVLTPPVFLLVVYAMWRAPMRHSMLFLTFLALVFPDPGDRPPIEDWNPPLAGAGEALLSHLNAAARPLGISWASFSLMDLFLAALLLISYYRTSTRQKIDAAESPPTPEPLMRLTALALYGTALTWVVGLVTGGNFGKSLWQLNRVMYLPPIFYLFSKGLRGPKDLGPLLKVILVAALYKSFSALWVALTIVVPADPNTGSTRPVFATSHQDSILFATAFLIVCVMVLERVGGLKRAMRLAFVVLPILAGGMWANNRRTAWVQIALGLFAIYMMTADNPIKRRIRKGLFLVAPIAAIYVAIGWQGGGTLFKPVHMMRSIVDAKSDGSTNWRELENFDLMQTLKANPLLGLGYGHEYYEIIKLPAVGYDLELYCPHNSLLGIWAFGGLVGYTMLTLLWIGAVYFAARAYHASRDANIRAAALASIGGFVVYLLQCWGDLGIGTWVGVFISGASFAMAGKLAVVTGEWRPRKVARRA